MKKEKFGIFFFLSILILAVVAPASAQNEGYIIVGSINPDPSGLASDMTGAIDISQVCGFGYGYQWGYDDGKKLAPYDPWKKKETDFDNQPILGGFGYLDTEVTDYHKNFTGRIYLVIGGPVSNLITKELVETGKSKVDWGSSPGQSEYIPNAWGANSSNVYIVAGKDRRSTREACWNFAVDKIQGDLGYLQPGLFNQ